MIERKDWKGLNFQEIETYKELLEEYGGYIPLIFHNHISNIRRIEYLEENGLYESIQKQIYEKREEFKKSEDKSEWLIKDILDWINENPFFEVLVEQ